MTDEQILFVASEIDVFVADLMNEYKINVIDISAVINSRLRMISAMDELEEDYDALVDHLNSQTVIVPKTIH
jgi:hypothetical protein